MAGVLLKNGKQWYYIHVYISCEWLLIALGAFILNRHLNSRNKACMGCEKFLFIHKISISTGQYIEILIIILL